MLNKPSTRWMFIVAQIVGVVLLVTLWRQWADLAQLKQAYARLEKQNRQLHAELLRQAGVPAAAPEVPAPGPVVPPPPAVEANELRLDKVEVQPVSGGLRAVLHFRPTRSGPLGLVMVTVRLPKEAAVNLLELAPADTTAYAKLGKRVTPDGKFAMFQGEPGPAVSLALGLSLSGPATVDVRGTCGLAPFKLEITPAGATVRGP